MAEASSFFQSNQGVVVQILRFGVNGKFRLATGGLPCLRPREVSFYFSPYIDALYVPTFLKSSVWLVMTFIGGK